MGLKLNDEIALGASSLEPHVEQARHRIDKLIGEDSYVELGPDMDELARLIGQDASHGYLECKIAYEDLKRRLSDGSLEAQSGKGSPGKKSECLPTNAGEGEGKGRCAWPLTLHQVLWEASFHR